MAVPLMQQQSLWPLDESVVSAPPTPPTPTLTTSWRVRASNRARRLSLRVHQDGSVEVVKPARCSERVMQQFVASHGEWIRRQQQRLRPFIKQDAFPPLLLELPALAQTLQWNVPAGATPARSRAIAIRWLCDYARARFEPLLQQLAAQMGVSYQRLQLRSQRSRWGSCSTRGTISLNCALLFQPPEVVRYLMIHELAHRRHMNHSQRFWALVAQHEPGWKPLDRQLRHGWRAVPSWLLQREGRA